jgi:hypothetical protein
MENMTTPQLRPGIYRYGTKPFFFIENLLTGISRASKDFSVISHGSESVELYSLPEQRKTVCRSNDPGDDILVLDTDIAKQIVMVFAGEMLDGNPIKPTSESAKSASF